VTTSAPTPAPGPVPAPATVTHAQARARLAEFTVVDVRTPGEYAGGHLPGALNIPLDRLDEAVDALKAAAARGPLLIVCASGARSARGCVRLAALGVEAATLEGGTGAWAAAGRPVERSAGARAPWPMDRQVRFAAGALVVVGFGAGLARPRGHWLSGLIGAGLVFSGVTNTCGMAAVLAKLPHNRPPKDAFSFEETVRRLASAV
jgi:rhodanese-related sulfurtransferase